MAVQVELSTVDDGSLYNRANPSDPAVVKNRRRWFTAKNLDINDATRLRPTYFDGDETFVNYRVVDVSEKAAGMYDDAVQKADALVTTHPGHVLFLPVSDCVATTLYDEEHGVLMLTHLGRQSLEQNGGEQSVQFLVEQFGSDPSKLKVWLSASISKDKYQIFRLDHKGMKEVVHEQLALAGILPENITEDTADTAQENYYSYSEFLKGNKPEDGSHAMAAVMI